MSRPIEMLFLNLDFAGFHKTPQLQILPIITTGPLWNLERHHVGLDEQRENHLNIEIKEKCKT